MKQLSILCLLYIFYGCSNSPETLILKENSTPPISSPFPHLDIIATNDWWNRDENQIIDVKVPRSDVIAFGIYTVALKTLRLTAQFFPLYPSETRKVRLEVLNNGNWKEIQNKQINDIGWSATFEIKNWIDSINTPYRICHGDSAFFQGLIRKNPTAKNEILVAALSCNSNTDRGNRANYVRNINHQNPDLIFFAGDQSYDHTEHTAAWLKFGIQFREIFRNRPCITIPDDHDIGQGNLWGESGRKAKNNSGTDAGYFHPAEYIKMVERCQTAHLPAPYDSTRVEQGIGVYYTNFVFGEIDFAILEDRKFKSCPNGNIPQLGPRPDHITDKKYDPKSIDLEGLKMLGDRQLLFLNEWANQKENNKMKVVLSQTGFCGGAHLHGNKKNRLIADMDSNGWPQTGRKKALKAIKKANAIHIAGDQHIATVVQHGLNEFEEGPWAFVVPSIVNNYYSRWWWPKNELPGENPLNILPWTGRYKDGFSNKITMHAYANPDAPSNGAGYGLIRLNKTLNQVTFECWPRHVDVSDTTQKQFLGWPITISL